MSIISQLSWEGKECVHPAADNTVTKAGIITKAGIVTKATLSFYTVISRADITNHTQYPF